MSIKLICSDIDGTLLQYGKKELEDEIFEQIRELHRRGILFCPASGRQYTCLLYTSQQHPDHLRPQSGKDACHRGQLPWSRRIRYPLLFIIQKTL